MTRMVRYGWLLTVAVLMAGPVVAVEGGDFEDLLIDEEDKPKTLTDEQKKLQEAQGHFKGFLQSCNDKAWDKATEQLRKVLVLDISPDIALKLRDLASARQIVAILAEAPDRLKLHFRRLLKISEEGRRRWVKNQKRIEGLVKQLVEGDNEQMWMAVRELILAGQYAAPQLVGKLLDERNRQARTRAALALKHAGRSVTLPLAEALLGVNDHVKQDICFILRESPKGDIIPDRRALPALKAVAQNPNANRSTREEAVKTILTIIPAQVTQIPSAQELYLNEAERYYRRDVAIVEPTYEDYIIWSWRSNKLVPRIVPEYAYYLEMAEKYCRHALSLDPDYEKAKPLLICIIYAQYHTVAELQQAVERNPELGLSQQDVQGLAARKQRLEQIINTLPSLGKKHFYAALQKALRDGQTSVAVSCIDVLKELGCGKELGSATMAIRP